MPSASRGAGVAADILSNINSDIIPKTDDVFDIGIVGKRFRNIRCGRDLIVGGDLTVQGMTTTIESQTLTVEDKSIELAKIASPTDVFADGGGITLKGDTDKTILWNNATDSWNFNQKLRSGNIELDGNTIRTTNVNGDLVLTPNGTGVVRLGMNLNTGGFSIISDTNVDIDIITSGTGVVNIGSMLAIGDSPSVSGGLGLTNGEAITARNNANTGDIVLLTSALVSSRDAVILGNTAGSDVLIQNQAADRLGFFGVTPIARAGTTGDIKNALTSYGLLQGTGATPLNLDGGVLTAGQVTVDNLRLDGNVFSSIDTNGVILIAPNGTGSILLTTDKTLILGSSPSATGDNSEVVEMRDDRVTTGSAPNYVLSINQQNGTLSVLSIGNDGDANAILVTNNNDLRIGNDISGTFTEHMRVESGGNVGIGTSAPQAPLQVSGVGVTVGGFPSGQFHVTSDSSTQFRNAVITGHNLFGGNTQLWYLGSVSGSNDDIALINRQTGTLSLQTSGNGDILLTPNGTGKVFVQKDLQIVGDLINFGLNSNSNSFAAGTGALGSTTTGFDNVAVGVGALDVMTSGSSNVAVGHLALNLATNAKSNVAVGANALGVNTAGDFNVAIGHNALKQLTVADDNIAIGFAALQNVTTGIDNIGIGCFVGEGIVTGSRNILIGEEANFATDVSDMLNIGNSMFLSMATSNFLGLGVSSPTSSIHIQRAGQTEIALEAYSAVNSIPVLSFKRSDGATVGVHAAVDAGDILGLVDFNGSDGTVFRSGTHILATAEETFTATSVATSLRFFTTPVGSVIPIERLTLAPSGNVGIGASTPDPSAKLDIFSTTLGFLGPRMTTVQIDGIVSPAIGLESYDTTINKKKVFTGAEFKTLLTEDIGQVLIQETFASSNVRFFGELGLPAAQGWTDTPTGIATIDLVTQTVFGEVKQVVRHNDDSSGATTSDIVLTAQNWIDINAFGASYGGTARLDTVDGASGFFSGLQANAAENPLVTGNRRYGILFDNSGGNLRLRESDNTGNAVIMDGTSGNPLITFDEWFSWECVIPAGLGAAELYINGILTSFIPTFLVNGGGLGTAIKVGSGSSAGVNRIVYHDNFGVTIYEEAATKTLAAATMVGDVSQINIPEGKRDYTIVLPDGNPRAIGAVLRLVASNLLGSISLENQNPAVPEVLYNGLRTLVINVAVKETIEGINTVSSGNVYLGFQTAQTKNHLDEFDANDATFPATDPAAANSRNAHPILAFDDGVVVAGESVVFHNAMSRDYSGGNILVDIDWVAATAISGGVTWGVEFERVIPGGQDIDSDGFAAQKTATGTANGTSGVMTRTTITLTQAEADTIVAGDTHRLRLERVTGDGGDTLVGDAQVLSVIVRQ